MRAIFSLKRYVFHRCISITTIFRLFDALILPILTYACQVTFPYSKISSALTSTSTNQENWQGTWLTKVSNDPFEKLHLKFIKWALGVHKKASNIGAWGETGRHPIGIQMLKQTISYYNRVSIGPSSIALVHLSFLEQQSENMNWFTCIKNLLNAHSTRITTRKGLSVFPAAQTNKSAKTMFESIWKGGLTKSPKLDFYNKIKHNFSKEHYLDCLDFDLRNTLTKLRISAHKLRIEQGRYLVPLVPRPFRFCKVCKEHDNVTKLGDEAHLLLECRSSEGNRGYLSRFNLNLIEDKSYERAMELSSDDTEIKNLAIFVKRSYNQYINDSKFTDIS